MKFVCAAFCALSSYGADAPSVFDSIFRNDLPALKKLAHNREPVNEKSDHDVTPLVYACSYGSAEAVRILLRAGAK